MRKTGGSQTFPLSEQWVRQEIKAHSNLAHGIIKVSENNVLLTGELCHAAAGRRTRASQGLFTADEEARQSRGRGSFVCFKKVLIFKEGPWIKPQNQQYEYLQGQTQQSHTREVFLLAFPGTMSSSMQATPCHHVVLHC